MPHTLLKINLIPTESAFEALAYIQGKVSSSDFTQYFSLLRESSVADILKAVDLYNNQHDNDNENGEDPEFSSDIYKEFTDNDIASTERTTVRSGLFSGGATSLSEFYYSSTLGDVSASYIPVYDKATTDSTAQVQFAVGYANYGGSGSIGNTTKTTAGNRETAALYRQFRNVILGQGTEKFAFTGKTYGTVTGGDPDGQDDFVFIAFNRAQMREKVDPGNWELRISGSLLSASSSIKLIDDSSATTNTDVNVAGRVFNVVSGSIESGTASIKTAASAETANGAAGLFYPDLGIILLNPDWLMINSGRNFIPSKAANTFGNNARKLYNALSSSAYFAARREEEISSVSYFARARNDQFNYSSNPTYSTGSIVDGVKTHGKFKVPSFQGDPRAYITQVGLYDDNSDLLAVAKLSQPILKSFSREAVVKVKLDY